MTTIIHGKVSLELHDLRNGSGRPLLVLHGLGERITQASLNGLDHWPGPVYGLDFTGHGQSTVPAGGGYTCEVLMGDVDLALSALGEATIFGRGLGGYVGLLVAGSRPDLVRGAIIADGPGLAGGGPEPLTNYVVPAVVAQIDQVPDPLAVAELSRDVRPPDYATSFVRQANHLSGIDTPITVTAIARPPWLAAVVGEPDVATGTIADALARYASV